MVRSRWVSSDSVVVASDRFVSASRHPDGKAGMDERGKAVEPALVGRRASACVGAINDTDRGVRQASSGGAVADHTGQRIAGRRARLDGYGGRRRYAFDRGTNLATARSDKRELTFTRHRGGGFARRSPRDFRGHVFGRAMKIGRDHLQRKTIANRACGRNAGELEGIHGRRALRRTHRAVAGDRACNDHHGEDTSGSSQASEKMARSDRQNTGGCQSL